jgi:DNA-directed RNA polymerase specialized sigma24 family protein
VSGATLEELSVDSFTQFVAEMQDGLRRALIAGFGPEVGREAAEETLIYGWCHWERVQRLDNPSGYLYRVGRRRALKMKSCGLVRASLSVVRLDGQPLVGRLRNLRQGRSECVRQS